MNRLTLQTTVSQVRYNGEELRVVRVEPPPKRLVAQAADSFYDVHADRRGAVCLAAAWALAMRSPRSLVHLPIRANLPPSNADSSSPALDLVFVHASVGFRVSAWKDLRARSRSGAAHRIDLGTVREEFPVADDVDFRSVFHRENLDHLRYAAAAETVFVVGSAPAFRMEGARIREFIEGFEQPFTVRHHCAEIYPALWKPGRKRRIGPTGLHIIRETQLWPAGNPDSAGAAGNPPHTG